MSRHEFMQTVPNMPGIRVISPEEAEQCDIVICMPDVPGRDPGPLAAHFGQCSECYCAIHWAESAPKTVRKVCLRCGYRLARREEAE